MQSSVNTCVRADVRVQASARPSCSFYKNNSTLTFGLLHPPSELSSKKTSMINETTTLTWYFSDAMKFKSDMGIFSHNIFLSLCQT